MIYNVDGIKGQVNSIAFDVDGLTETLQDVRKRYLNFKIEITRLTLYRQKVVIREDLPGMVKLLVYEARTDFNVCMERPMSKHVWSD